MPAVFVHGNPETDVIWQPLLAELGREDVVCLSPPGFGAPVPPGFGATMGEYRDWLIDELTALPGPIDLVGHDWGGGHTMNVAMRRPELLRSWCTDAIGIYEPDYVWHDLAQVWQKPEAGEQFVAQMLAASTEQRATPLAAAGVPQQVAERVAAGFDEAMAQCILPLYRSAAQPALTELGKELENAAARPGLAVLATGDSYVGSMEMRERSARRAGARVEVLDGLGHWWMLQDPRLGADILNRFWSTLD